jgi:hypothetical protein
MPTNRNKILVAPTKGLNAKANLMAMAPDEALVLENWIPYPDALEMRPGNSNHVTGAASPLLRLWTYSSNAGVESLWATSNTGIYNVTAAGALPALSIALTNGQTIATSISTGANNYMMVVNGTDTLKQYDGAAWSSIALFGATATSVYSYIETYQQRIFLIRKNTLTLEYLPINSISGTPVTYDLGAIFRRGGRLVALGTWTIDGGVGANDKLVAVTSQGEVAIFSGADPSSASTWTNEGVYYIGKPLGNQPLTKAGGDLIYISEVGIFPISKALQSVAIEYNQAISDKIQPILSLLADNFGSTDGWQVILQPTIPLLILNIPSTPLRVQYCLHTSGGGWCSFSGWAANNFALLNKGLYFATNTGVQKVEGTADVGADIVATMLSSYTQLNYLSTKRVAAMRPFFQPQAPFSYVLAMANDFETNPGGATIPPASAAPYSVWGTGLFGSAYWGSSDSVLQDWRAPADLPKSWKAVYIQVTSKISTIRYLGAEAKLLIGKGMGY